MADPVSLEAVLLGGKLALAGAAIPALFVFVDHWLERRQRNRDILRTEYEELASAVDESVAWFYTLDAAKTHEDIVAAHPSRCARRIASLAAIYFPKLKDAAISYNDGLVEYYAWMANFTELDGQPIGILAATHPELGLRIEAIDTLRNNLEEAISKHAHKYTSA